MYPWVDCVLTITTTSSNTKKTDPNHLYLRFEKNIAVGIRPNAAKADWKFGFPNVPITPFVRDSHFKKSTPKLWKSE